MSGERRLRAGIDEAGYGPLLGPLVVGLAAFGLPPGVPPPRSLLGRRIGRGAGRVAVEDSKRLHRGGAGFADLERTALAFLGAAAGGVPPATLGALLERHAHPLPPLDLYPWYGAEARALSLPVAADAEETLRASASLARSLSRRGAEPLLLVSCVLVGEFNEAVRRSGSKARLLFERNALLLGSLRRRLPGSGAVLVDRHGGRKRYGPLLLGSFPLEAVEVVVEDPRRSRYRLGRGEERLELSFEVEADARAFETALASILAKYTRELLVRCLNRHFLRRLPGLRPTAGYVQDGRRFVEDLDRAGLISPSWRRLLVRER